MILSTIVGKSIREAHGKMAAVATPKAIGNPQLVDGLNADDINEHRRYFKFLNLAFNDLRSPDLVAVMETFYKKRDCTVERLYVNGAARKTKNQASLKYRYSCPHSIGTSWRKLCQTIRVCNPRWHSFCCCLAMRATCGIPSEQFQQFLVTSWKPAS
ncbi:MAG: hypothetical protein IPP88_20830 [Betaproteobacteria bacterium]|nr:hypothetical protein [Betaproteobacteria bacterium]